MIRVVSKPEQLLSMMGETIYMVHSMKDDIECVLIPWNVGKIGKLANDKLVEVTDPNQFTYKNGEMYVCFNYDNPKLGISIKDFGIIRNNYNQHKSFVSLKAAAAHIKRKSLVQKECDFNYWFSLIDIEKTINKKLHHEYVKDLKQVILEQL